jgi:hypothetical protein
MTVDASRSWHPQTHADQRRVQDIGPALLSRGIDVEDVLRVPPQGDGAAPRSGDLGLEGSATREVVIEARHVVPAHFHWRAVAGADVGGID